MSCGCKNGSDNKEAQKQIDSVAFTNSLFMRLFLFILSIAIVVIALVPIMLPLIFIMLFNRIVLQKSTNLTGVLLKVGKAFKTSKKRDEDDDDDYEDINEINPEEYELVDVDVIK